MTTGLLGTPVVPAGTAGSVLVVDDDEVIVRLVEVSLVRAGYRVTTALNAADALELLDQAVPDAIVSDVDMPGMNGFELVRRLRSHPVLRAVPLLFLTSRSSTDDVVHGIDLGADDYITKPFRAAELIARVEAKVHRPPVPLDRLRTDRRSGLASAPAFLLELERESERAGRSRRPGFVAVLGVHETASIRRRFGDRGVDELHRRIGEALAGEVTALETAGRTGEGDFALLLPETDENAVQGRLQALAERLARAPLSVAGDPISVTPLSGFTGLEDQSTAAAGLQSAGFAMEHAGKQLDLQPVRFRPEMAPADPQRRRGRHRRTRRRRDLASLRTPLQIALTVLIGLVLPFLLYWTTDRAGFSVVPAAYVLVVLGLLVTATSIYVEGLLALDVRHPPPSPQELDETLDYPPASALIAAYLPNEAATILETVEAFLRVRYAGPLQVVLAYNTPHDLPVEAALRELAARDDRLLLLRVESSSSKAQNVNAALSQVTGTFTGIFDADHHPDPDSFVRAWRWISDGYGVVQGHPVVRNGDVSWVARTVAVEFEAIYAVSHPGRNRLHGFGIFGGSNGYWRTDLLRETRFRGAMLTEDIDSSLRVVLAGHRIANDPLLITSELAPTALPALWNQRMRWAQGWVQVSAKHLRKSWRSPVLSLQQKLGVTFLLGWREVYPWISLQMIPLLAFYGTQEGGLTGLNWFVALFVLTTAYTLGVGPVATLFAYWQAAPSIRQRRRWFWAYLLVSSLFYTEYKNTIARVAQIKELMGEKAWKVTPRAAEPAPADVPAPARVPVVTG